MFKSSNLFQGRARDCFAVIGDEQASGVPNESLSLERLLNEFVESKSCVVSKQLDVHGVISHATQCHDRLGLCSRLYTEDDMHRHPEWYHIPQSSHAIALSFQVTALEQIWQGYFGFLGPGFSSISGMFASRMKLRYRYVCSLPLLMLRNVDRHLSLLLLLFAATQLNTYLQSLFMLLLCWPSVLGVAIFSENHTSDDNINRK
jgi:hypothetical protein